MQGWRFTQEDAYIANPNFDTGTGIFGVFDGHGGFECAKYCEKFFETQLKQQPEYENKSSFERAL